MLPNCDALAEIFENRFMDRNDPMRRIHYNSIGSHTSIKCDRIAKDLPWRILSDETRLGIVLLEYDKYTVEVMHVAAQAAGHECIVSAWGHALSAT